MDADPESYVSSQNSNCQNSNTPDDNNQVLRLNHPVTSVLQLSEPIQENNHLKHTIDELSTLNLTDRPSNLTINKSILTSTVNHPLMLVSPETIDYPDVVPIKKVRDEDLSLSSVEDNQDFYQNGPQRNTSKNNLYFSDHNDVHNSISPPDIVRGERRKIPSYIDRELKPCTPKMIDDNDASFSRYADQRLKNGDQCRSTPKAYDSNSSPPVSIPHTDNVNFGVAEWCDSPSQLRTMPNFELPIELSSSIGMHNDLDSPDVISSSTQGDHSTYQALLDPYSGNVSLLHHSKQADITPRRRIVAQLDMDQCSSDSELDCSIKSEEVDLQSEPSNHSSKRNSISENSSPIQEYSAAEERDEERAWLKVALPGGGFRSCDMKVIEPYKRVVSHGGYESSGAAIIVFSACHLPHSARVDYNYVMDNLFLYVLWTLERLVTDDYVLIYLHGSAASTRTPTFHWLHQCYKLIHRRLRKSLKHLYLVHPTFWIKTIVLVCKPFVSSKFFRKISYIKNLNDLMDKVPVEPVSIPDSVREYDSVKR